MMGTHIRVGCRLLSKLSSSCHSIKQTRCNFSTIRKLSSLCGANSPAITHMRSLPTFKVRSLSSSKHRPFSSDASPHPLSNDFDASSLSPDSSNETDSEVRPFHRDEAISDGRRTSDSRGKPAVKRETLFDREFSQLDDLKEELEGRRKSVDVAAKSKRPEGRKVKPNLQPSFNFAAYVNDSPLLTELIQLGVNLTKWEKGQIPNEVIQLDSKRDLAPIVRHLRKLGVNDDKDIGKILTKNPYILINGLSQFKEKTDYFLKKKFSPEQLTVIMKGAPQLFSRTVESIDARLGFFQKSYGLTGDQLRETIVAHPDLFQMKLDWVKKVNFHMNKFLRFKPNEVRELFITVPSIFMLREQNLDKRFDQLHNVMMIPHQSLVKFPYLLKVPLIVVKQRHKFLQTVSKAIYDPLEDGYTSLTAFTDYNDERFATEIAKVDFETYKNFLKTL